MRPVKTTTRDKLLEVAHGLVMVHGFNNTGIGQIVKDAGVPKGSFYHYFPSKDELGYALVNDYSRMIKQHLQDFLQAQQGPALHRLRAYFVTLAQAFRHEFGHCNCLLGNMGQELAGQHEGFRRLVRQHFVELEGIVATTLQQAKAEGDLAPDADCQMLAELLFSGWEGGIIRAKLEGSSQNLEGYIEHFFGSLPRP